VTRSAASSSGAIYGKRIIIIGGGAQVGQVALGAISEADRHNIRGERISVDRALRAITVDAAFVLRRDHEIGSLEVGKLADLAILGADPYEVEPIDLRNVPVLGTIVGGAVHMAND